MLKVGSSTIRYYFVRGSGSCSTLYSEGYYRVLQYCTRPCCQSRMAIFTKGKDKIYKTTTGMLPLELPRYDRKLLSLCIQLSEKWLIDISYNRLLRVLILSWCDSLGFALLRFHLVYLIIPLSIFLANTRNKGLGELTFLQLSTTYKPPSVAGRSVGWDRAYLGIMSTCTNIL